MSGIGGARTWLFTPASRPDRFEKALSSGADVVIFDLEDAVAESEKVEARRNVLTLLRVAPTRSAAVVVRINALTRAVGLEDLAALAGVRNLRGVLLPKIESADVVRLASAVLDDAGSAAAVVALIESARGVARVDEIADAGGRLQALMFGGADYASDLGQLAGAFDARHARARLVNAAAASGLSAIDTPTFDLRDPEGWAAACADARAMGFFGKAAIHPAQLEFLSKVFAPQPAEIDRAREILAAPQGVVVVDGRMVDAAMVRWAKRLLATKDPT